MEEEAVEEVAVAAAAAEAESGARASGCRVQRRRAPPSVPRHTPGATRAYWTRGVIAFEHGAG